MLRFLYRSLLLDRGRTLLSVLAVASAIVLVVVLEGFKVGLWQQVRSYREHLQVQLVANPAGASSMLQTRSALPADVLDQVGAVPGVRQVYPLVNVPAIFVRDDLKTPITVVGYDRMGGPWRLKDGRLVAVHGEMVMDYALAKKYGYIVGDQTTLFGKEFQIVGLSTETASLLGSYVFIGLEDAFFLLSASQTSQETTEMRSPNLLLVEIEPDAQVSRVRNAIEEVVPAVSVLTPAELAANDVAMVRELLGSVMNLMISVAYVVGVLIIGLTLYATVFERLREYGIMKAIGARNSRLYQYVLGYAFIFTAAGFVLGVIASLVVAALIAWLLPQYLVVPWDTQVLLRAGVAGLLMASVASLLPIRQVAGVDPATVFRQ